MSLTVALDPKVIILDMAAKRRDLSKMTENEKREWKAKQNNIRKRRWRDKQREDKKEKGEYNKHRVIDSWMVDLVRRGV